MRPWSFLVYLLAASAAAHEVQLDVAKSEAIVLTLTYGNGQPFAYEKYALTPVGEQTPRQVGQTDAAGRIVFLPGAIGRWRLTATSPDGHGIEREIDIEIPMAPPARTAPSGHGLSWLDGLAILFGLFGVWQLFSRRRR
ncbi:MAG: hypothetical protein N2441_09920 [Rhodocyclaceae bacterium]|nr:hypothetical protein [Rhodocyclaceae bacterium]